MNSQEKQGYIDEINYQKKMIHNLIKWLRNLFFLSSLGVLLMYYFSNILFVKIFAIILIIISILAIILVGKAIYSGIQCIFDQRHPKIGADSRHKSFPCYHKKYNQAAEHQTSCHFNSQKQPYVCPD